jgi:hypothetical protein
MDTRTLDGSRDHMLGTTADGGIRLAQATAVRLVAAWTLAPAPPDPVRHLEVSHARARSHLDRLTDHDPSREVPAAMTTQLFARLTDIHPAPPAASQGVDRYQEACRRLGNAVSAASRSPADGSTTYPDLYGARCTPEQVIGDVL